MFKDSEKERVSGELNAAAKIQMGILPKLGMQYDERLVLALNRNSGAAPDELLKNVKESIDGFVGDAEQFDDITMLAFRYNGK